MIKFEDVGLGIVLYNEAAINMMRMLQHQKLLDPTKDNVRLCMEQNSYYKRFENPEPWRDPFKYELPKPELPKYEFPKYEPPIFNPIPKKEDDFLTSRWKLF
jgi:hypothetical protein